MFQTSRSYQFGIQMALSLILAAGASQAAVVFSEDFESGAPAQISGPGIDVGTEGFSAFGFGNTYHRNDSLSQSTVLTLNGLGSHTHISLSFSVAILDSWDSENCCGPDHFVVKIDGITVFDEVFVSADTAQFGIPTHSLTELNSIPGNYAYNNGWNDRAYNISIPVEHTSPFLEVTWTAVGTGWQGLDDESFAIDNVQVETRGDTNGVPDGGSAALMLGLSLLGLATARRSMARKG